MLCLFSATACDLLIKAANVYTETSIDADGNEITVEYMYDPKDNDRITRKTVYDKDGNVEVNYNYNKDGEWSEEYYDGNPNRTRCITHRTSGEIIEEEFIQSGTCIKSTTYSPSGVIERIDEYYDDGTQRSLLDYTVPGISRRYIQYNEQGQQISDETVQMDGERVSTTTTYFEDEQIISVETLVREQGGAFVSHQIEYWTSGRATKTVVYDENGTVIEEWMEK